MKLLLAFAMLASSGWSQQPLSLEMPKLVCFHEQVLGYPPTYPADPRPYRFLAAGHWYGAHENSRSITPSGSLLAALPRIRESQPTWIFALGDVVRDADDGAQVTAYEETLLTLGQSAILVPGNHDLCKNGRPAPGLGSVLKSFESFGDVFLMLETERLLQGGGRKMLEELEQSAQRYRPQRNVFVFSHRLIWALTEPGFLEMDAFANAPLRGNFPEDTLRMVYAAVLSMAGDRPLYWLSGDIGASWSWNVFAGHSEDGRRHFYAAGLGDCTDDAFWEVRVDSLGHVEPRIFWLTPGVHRDSLPFDQAYWRKMMRDRQPAAPSWLQRLAGNWKWLALGLCVGAALGWGLRWVLERRGRHRA